MVTGTAAEELLAIAKRKREELAATDAAPKPETTES